MAATRELSGYGTADAVRLENTRLDWLNLVPIEDDRDRLYVQRFWTLYTQQRGVVLTSWETSRESATDNAMAELTEPIERVTFDPNDVRREIRRVDGSDRLPNIWSLVFVVDASGSMQHAFDQIRSEIPLLAERVYEAGATIRVAIVPFRERPLESFALTPIRSEQSDGGTSVLRLREFLDTITPTNARVDPDQAMRSAIALVSADDHRPTYTSIILVGDTHGEVHHSSERYARLLADLGEWAEAATGRSVRSINVGSVRTIEFDRLGTLTGRRTLSNVHSLSDEIARRAANVSRGLDPE